MLSTDESGGDRVSYKPDVERFDRAYDLFDTDPAQAVAEFQRLVAEGSPRSALHLGWAYDTGTGVPKDYAKAEENYKLAIKRGSVIEATFFLGRLYQRMEQYDKANSAYEQVANQYAPAAYWLARNIVEERYPNQDFERVITLLQFAAAKGHIRSMFLLGSLYLLGQFGITKILYGPWMLLKTLVLWLRIRNTDDERLQR